MCPRRINGGVINPLIQLEEISLTQFKEWLPVDFLKQLNSLFMCGNLGDPIVAKDCLEIFKYIKEVNPSLFTSMHTNGSARTTSWWSELAKVCDRVVFGIDGLEDTHHLYRIDTDWHKIIENAKAYISNGGKAHWNMLVFAHNEHQIESCEQMSKHLGFELFTMKHTTRFQNEKFHVLDNSGKTINILYPTEFSKKFTKLVQDNISDCAPVIDCKALKYKQIYVAASGNVSPCCWLSFDHVLHKQDTRIDYMDKIDMFPNLNKQSLSDIFASNYFNLIEQTWGKEPLTECSKQCGKFDKLNAQFINTSKS
jgi:MoaA/NifB/PqqE/SkfB family radical SAM enzyme